MVRRLLARLRQRFRQRRYEQIQALMQIESLSGYVLDLGGGPASFFVALFPQPERALLVDIDYDKVYQAKKRVPALNVIVADAGRLPFAKRSIDATICNSVIEHVAAPDALATEVRRVSKEFFLQTPNGGFPLETHSFIAIPFYNLLPWIWLRKLTCRLLKANFDYISSVRYLPEQKLIHLFPESIVAYERVLGLKKSFYVYHRKEEAP